MNLHVLITTVLILVNISQGVFGAACDIAVPTQTKQNSPLLLKSVTGTDINTFFLPDQTGMISFNLGQKFIAACPGNDVMLNGHSLAPPLSEIKFECGPNNKWNYLGTLYDFMQITCRDEPQRLTKATGTCLSNYKQLDIGYQTSQAFISLMTVCFDAQNINTYYAQFELNKNLQHIKCPRVKFEEDGQFSVTMDPLYSRKTQQATINALVGLPSTNDTYVDLFGKYLSRGHLTAKTDYTYSTHQLCTFFYINTAPQWQSLNGGSWNNLEDDVRMFSTNSQVDLTVVTGTYGVLQLPNRAGNPVDIFMYTSTPTFLVPVPKYIWKFVYEPIKNEGVVFISTNNPYAVLANICTNVCTQIKFARTSSDIHCCTYQDFRAVVNTFPAFSNTMGLLTG